MTEKKSTWRCLLTSCYKADSAPTKPNKAVTKTTSFERLSLSYLSNTSSTLSEDLSTDSIIHVFTLTELKVITECFSSRNLIGKGGFGPVHKGFVDDNIKPGLRAQLVAVKAMNLDGTQGHREWLSEVVYLGLLRHPHLVKLIGYCCEDEYRLLVYKYMPKGSLEHQLFTRYNVPLPWSTRMKIALGAAKGLAFLHGYKQPVIHRDFKPANILLDSDYTPKLSDFGLAKDPDSEDEGTVVSTPIMGTEGYAAPEYIKKGRLTAMIDIYSFGVVLLELITGRKSLDKKRPTSEYSLVDWAKPMLIDPRMLSQIMDPRMEGLYCETGAKKVATLAYQCLYRQPKHRPTMRTTVQTLELLTDFDDVSTSAPFVYTIPLPMARAGNV